MSLEGDPPLHADRLTGMELHVPWPSTLAAPRGLRQDEDREASAVEDAAARALIAPELDRLNLVVIRVWVALVRDSNSQRYPLTPHLVIRLVSRRFEAVHRRQENILTPSQCWISAHNEERPIASQAEPSKV